MRLDAIDLRVLGTFQKEGRITKLALAARVNLSPTPCRARLKRLEKAVRETDEVVEASPPAAASIMSSRWSPRTSTATSA